MTRGSRSRALRPVGLGFADTAPVLLVFSARMAAPPADVHRALAEEVEAWPRWFRAVTLARQVERAGRRGREIRLVGLARFTETVVAVEPAARYAYRVDVTNMPGPRALLEDWRLAPAGGGTLLEWRIAVDVPAVWKPVFRLVRPVLGHAFRDSVRALDRRLAAV
ncbi:SRPBCC family protein [Streptomyces sp. NPDC053048]|uniref:SRPBCC family protein n=1 Tax=Streptomyces sp. NPDC053048 TaxID=3365694 RepID=UPI0037CFD2E3